jgi:hypothetical protein
LFEYFLVRKNEGKEGKDRHHLTVCNYPHSREVCTLANRLLDCWSYLGGHRKCSNLWCSRQEGRLSFHNVPYWKGVAYSAGSNDYRP